MDLTPFVDRLRDEVGIAAEAAGEDARALADRLLLPLDAAIRLTLLDALSSAADEITRDLAPGSVDLRLRGRDPAFVVTPPPAEPPAAPPPATEPAGGSEPTEPLPAADEGAASRINFRLGEALKQRIERAASAEGLSVNAWLGRIAVAALQPGSQSGASGAKFGAASSISDAMGIGNHVRGWVR